MNQNEFQVVEVFFRAEPDFNDKMSAKFIEEEFNFPLGFTRTDKNLKLNGGMHEEDAMNQAFAQGQNVEEASIFGGRSVSVGDIFMVSKFVNNEEVSEKTFMVANLGFDEFNKDTGVFA